MSSFIITSAEPTESPMGIPDNSVMPFEFSYLDSLYFTEFNDSYDLDLTEGYNSHIEFNDGQLKIYSGYEMDESYAYTREIGMDASEHAGLQCYEVFTEFTPMSFNYHDHFWIFDGYHGGEPGLYLKDNRELHLRYNRYVGISIEEYYDPFVITTLERGETYLIYMVVRKDLVELTWYYDIYVGSTLEKTFSTDYHKDEQDYIKFKFGDDMGVGPNEGKGTGFWDYFLVRGHSAMRFFDNFNDGNPFNWHVMIDPGTGAPGPSSKWEVEEEYHGSTDVINPYRLYLESWHNQNNDNVWSAAGRSLPIDYDPDVEYNISFDFMATSTEDFFVMMSNREIMLIYDNGSLKYYNAMNSLIYVDYLGADDWYFIEVKRTNPSSGPDLYEIWINREKEKTTSSFYDHGGGAMFLEFGDFINKDHWIRGAYWDNIRLWSDSETTSAGFSEEFLEANRTMVFMEDFEGSDLEEYNWTFEAYTAEGGWEHVNEESGANLWELGSGTQATHTGSRCAETVLNAHYPSSKRCRLVSPDINVTGIDNGTLTFWVYHSTTTDEYNTSLLEDGLIVKISSWNPATESSGIWTVLGTVASGFYTGTIDDLGLPGMGGWISTWKYKTVSLASTLPNDGSPEMLSIAFEFYSDANLTSYGETGISLDDIRIMGSPYGTTDPDFDDDGLTNEDEFYKFKSSPFDSDTDGDIIPDYDEVSKVEFYRWNYEGDGNYSADPTRRDIFVEVDWLNLDGDVMWDANVEQATRVALMESFWQKDISFHMLVDEEIEFWMPEDVYLYSEVNLNELQTLQSHFDVIDRQGYYHYCLAVKDITGYSFQRGYNGRSAAVFAISYEDCEDEGQDYDDIFAQIFQQALGENLGLHKYHNNKPWNPYYPGDTSMTMQLVKIYNYLGEDSDRMFTYGVTADFIPCGWEYSEDYWETKWQTGLFFYSATRYD